MDASVVVAAADEGVIPAVLLVGGAPNSPPGFGAKRFVFVAG